MLVAVQEHYRQMEESGKPRRHAHVIMPEWVSSEPRMEAQRHAMYERDVECIWSWTGDIGTGGMGTLHYKR
jgi:hypothetical protein